MKCALGECPFARPSPFTRDEVAKNMVWCVIRGKYLKPGLCDCPSEREGVRKLVLDFEEVSRA